LACWLGSAQNGQLPANGVGSGRSMPDSGHFWLNCNLSSQISAHMARFQHLSTKFGTNGQIPTTFAGIRPIQIPIFITEIQQQ
jgi:hypothetical protein